MKIFLLNIFFLCSFAAAQTLLINANGEIKNISVASSDIIVSSIDNTIVTSESANEEIRLIVELTAPSRLEQKLNGRIFSKSSSVGTQEQVLSSLPDAQINRTFETIMNGFVLTTKRENIRTISAMSGVRSVYPDMTVNAFPFSSRSSTHVVPASSASGASGNGIRVGIIDTGIDYLHEAFGGGFGNGYAVSGGYDFVNNDEDPMDDNGHGTHVAGIIAGHSSTISGVAQNAILFAYKALDRNGSGTASSVIAAIEQAIKDSVQVLNLSLGTSSGSLEDPLSRAVNRAVESGIVVVVAAGNNGDFSTINSPGVAELALTVGATDGQSIATFSSKGPETNQYHIKPDIVAPGVNILSAKMGGGYIEMSGTSMASPFVSAIAAAMRELHPDWTALNIRDAIISTASDVGATLFSQGHGTINERILEQNVFTSPALISFGFNPPASATWNQQRSITLQNKSAESKHYRFVFSSVNPAMQISCTPQFVEITPHSSVEVSVELETNNLSLSNNNEFENGYLGNILAVGSDDTLVIPFAFFKGPVLQLHFNEIPWMVMIHNGKDFSKTFAPKSTSLSLILTDGIYDVVASFYGSRYVVSENNYVNGKSDVDISSEEATIPVSFQPVDKSGTSLNLETLKGTYSYLEAFVHKASGFAIVGMGGAKTNIYSNQPKYFSPVSNNYSYGYSMTLQPNNFTSYTYDVIVDSGISSPNEIVFTASDIQRINVNYTLDQTVHRAFPIVWTTFVGHSSSLGVTFYDENADPLTYPFVQEAYYTKRSIQFPIFHQRDAYKF